MAMAVLGIGALVAVWNRPAAPASGGHHVGKVAAAPNPEVRIRVARGVTVIEIGAEHGPLRLLASDSSTTDLTIPARIEIGEAGLTVRGASGDAVRAGDWCELRAGSGATTLDGRAIPGAVRFVRAGGGIDAIATMPIETYVPGVLEAELYDGWPIETYKAQAIAARSYALHERRRARERARAYDLDDTTHFQAYAGEATRERALEAAVDTAGLVLAYDGDVLRAYYHSTSGGRPAGAADLWPIAGEWSIHLAPPLNPTGPREDYSQNSPTHRWEVTRRVRDLSRRVAAYGTQLRAAYAKIGRLTEIAAVRTNASGRPTLFRMTDDQGQAFEIGAEHLRLALNADAPGLAPLPGDARVLSNDLEITISGGRATIKGRGFGHGVGLCQFGAAEMGTQGFTCREILEHYYPGAEVMSAGDLARW